MPGQWHPPEVRERAIELWRGLEGLGKPLEPYEVAIQVSSSHPQGRWVSEESVKDWIRSYQKTGYSESERQHNARVRVEVAELHRKSQARRVEKYSADIQEALFDAISTSPIAYGRELQARVFHVTNEWVELDELWALRKSLYF